MNAPDFLWMAIMVGTQVLTLISLIVGLRRKPPISEELYRDFLAKVDHDTRCSAIGKRIDSLDRHNVETHQEIFKLIREGNEKVADQFDAFKNMMHQDFRTLERGLGQTEGQLKSH